MNDDENAFTYVVGICILLTLVAFMLFPFAAVAKDIATFESRGDRVTLTDQPCTSTVRNNIKPEWRDKFKAATYYVGQKRQTVQGCYMLYGDDYQTIWEDGDLFALPMSMFKQVRI